VLDAAPAHRLCDYALGALALAIDQFIGLRKYARGQSGKPQFFFRCILHWRKRIS
jgi:hypothetical protein